MAASHCYMWPPNTVNMASRDASWASISLNICMWLVASTLQNKALVSKKGVSPHRAEDRGFTPQTGAESRLPALPLWLLSNYVLEGLNGYGDVQMKRYIGL